MIKSTCIKKYSQKNQRGKGENMTDQNTEKIMEMLNLIYDEVKEVKVRVTNLESRMDRLEARMDRLEKRVESLEHRVEQLELRVESLEHRVEQLEIRMASLEYRVEQLELRMENLENRVGQLETQTASLQEQEKSNFVILERDLGAALDGMTILNKQKVDKKALKQATV